MSNFHCLVMCGPLALTMKKVNRGFSGLLYNTGRIATYTVLGGVFGWLGRGVVIIGTQKYVTLLAGVVFLIAALYPSSRVKVEKWLVKIPAFTRVRLELTRRMPVSGLANSLYVGVLNGLIPCGMVYLAVIGAINSGNLFSGATFMLVFGFSTLPAMFGATLLGNLSINKTRVLTKAIPVMLGIVGLFFIYRGLNVDQTQIGYMLGNRITDVNTCH